MLFLPRLRRVRLRLKRIETVSPFCEAERVGFYERNGMMHRRAGDVP